VGRYSRRHDGSPSVVVIGAGPAGLTAAYILAKDNIKVTVLEADPEYVGGLSRTVRYKGFHFDIGGHRFFSKSRQVEDLWTEILPNDMLERPRSSRVFYGGRFYSYPLRPLEALWKLGVVESGLCMLSYLRAQARPVRNPRSFEDWVSNQFGRRLFRIFFKTYTEKVWGMNCKEISADWAAQRIQGLSLWSAIKNGLGSASRTGQQPPAIKTLIDSFRYPRRGPGMMWEACASRVKQMGGDIRMGQRVEGCSWDGSMDQWKIQCTARNGQRSEIVADHVICSAPLRQLAQSLRPALPEDAIRAAGSLKYRDFLTVALITKDRKQFSDNWIYIHDPTVKVGRIQNYKAWSPEMVPDPAYVCYGLEYFCFEGDGLWQSSNEDLIALAKRELVAVGLASLEDITDGCVVRQPKAYPVYDDDYAENVQCVRHVIEADYPNLHLVGRNGMHKYNNQDHAMMTAMLTAANILAGETIHDVWLVNQDAEYHEAGTAGERVETSGVRLVPSRVAD
jgi:protoporphyrinogen oxidase